MGGYIYLICDPSNDTYKIGVTRNIESNRLKKLQTGNSTELHIVCIYKCDYPFRLETMLHSHYKNKQELNEWFNLEGNDIFKFEDKCKELDNTLHILLNNPFVAKNIK